MIPIPEKEKNMHFVISAKHVQQPCVVCGEKRPCTFCYGCGLDVVGQVHVCGPNKNGGLCWDTLHDVRRGTGGSLVKHRVQKSPTPKKRKRQNQPRRWSHESNRESKKPRLEE